jgi:hypothetical protein
VIADPIRQTSGLAAVRSGDAVDDQSARSADTFDEGSIGAATTKHDIVGDVLILEEALEAESELKRGSSATTESAGKIGATLPTGRETRRLRGGRRSRCQRDCHDAEVENLEW